MGELLPGYLRFLPLHWAAANGDAAEVEHLIQGADVNVDEPDRRNRTPLDWAACRCHPQAINVLVKAGADVNRTGKNGWTPLLLASESIEDACESAIIALINNGADVNCQIKKCGRTSLHHAVCKGLTRATDALIKAGADVNRAANNGAAPLHLAAGWGNSEAITVLVDAGAKVNQQDKYGRTPLHVAAGTLIGDEQVIDALVKAGADVNATDNEGNTPLDIARREEWPEKFPNAFQMLEKLTAQQ